MATKKQHTDFNREVAKYLESIGAETIAQSQFNGDWLLKTVAGDLNICVREPGRSEVFSIYCKFQGVRSYEAMLSLGGWYDRLNGSSNKCNFHSYDPSELLAEFKTELSSLLPVIA